MLKHEKAYLDSLRDLLDNGTWVYNERTGKKCLTKIKQDFTYDVGAGEVPILTTKKCFPVSAFAEVLGYMRRYTNAQQFADIGSKSWFANANKNTSWLNNPNRKGENECGIIYGAATQEHELSSIYEKLCNGVDDRGLIWNMWRPETFDKGCLRPCVYEWCFSLLNGKLDLFVTQRSCDAPLGGPYNALSFAVLLKIFAKITGNEVGKIYHRIYNYHLYEDQVDGIKEQLSRVPLSDVNPVIEVADWVQCLDDVIGDDTHAREYFTLTGYKSHPKIEFPFSE